MKFQKTLLAASLAVAAVSTNAADQWVGQDLHQYNQAGNATWVGQNPNYPGSTATTGWVQTNHTYQTDRNNQYLGTTGNQINTAGEGINATLNNYYAEALSQDFHLNNWSTGQTGETHAIDLGSKLNDGYNSGTNTVDPRTSIARYNVNNQNIVEIREYKTGSTTPETSYYSLSGNNLIKLTGAQADSIKTQVNQENFVEGGVISSWSTSGSIVEEIKRINNEVVKYGQISSTDSEELISGSTVGPNSGDTPNNFDYNIANNTQSTENSVELGILSQKVLGDVTSNVYGVSARQGSSVVSLTGAGLQSKNIVLANGDIQTIDGAVVVERLLSTDNGKRQHVREYEIDGKQVFAVTDLGTNEVSYYTGTRNTSTNKISGLTAWNGTEAQLNNQPLVAGGTLTATTGEYAVGTVKNVITDKNVTYSEQTSQYTTTVLNGNTTKEGTLGAYSEINSPLGSTAGQTKQSQSVVTGIIATEDNTNVYGLEVKKSNTDVEGVTTSSKTTITADYVDSGDFRINGVSIVDNIKESVDTAVEGASEAIDAKVAEVDQKIVQVDERLTQFNGVAAGLNNRVDQLNKRVDEVEKTAYRGTAIALAAQQNVPNIGAGQTAVFGGVGHYESESAFALGLATVLKDGRTSISGALGVAGGSEVGGRVGVAYVFGGK